MRNTVRLGLAAATLVALVAGIAGPGEAHRAPEVAADATVPVTNAWIQFRGIDYISLGITHTMSTANGDAFVFQTNDNRGVHVGMTEFGRFWDLYVGAPAGTDLAVGSYVDAARYPFAGSQNGFALTGDGRGCNQIRAEFRVNQITIVDHVVQALDLSFVQHCEDLNDFTEGRVVVNLATPAPLPSYQAAFAFEGGDAVTSGSYTYQNIGTFPMEVGRSERAGNSIFVNVPSTGAGPWYLALAAPSGQPLAVGTYTHTTKTGGPGDPRLSVSSVYYPTCDSEVGTFTINQLHVTAEGYVDVLDLYFNRTCLGGGTQGGVGRVLIGVPAPNPTATATIAPAGTVTQPGITLKLRSVAAVSGTITCHDADAVKVKITVSQPSAGGQVIGSTSATLACTDGVPQPWNIAFGSTVAARLVPGALTVTVETTASYTPWQGPKTSTSATVTLLLIGHEQPPIVPHRRPVLEPM